MNKKKNNSRLEKLEETIVVLESKKVLNFEEKKQLDRLYSELENLLVDDYEIRN